MNTSGAGGRTPLSCRRQISITICASLSVQDLTVQQLVPKSCVDALDVTVLAGDVAEADGVAVLTHEQAKEAARVWVASLRRAPDAQPALTVSDAVERYWPAAGLVDTVLS